MQVPAFQRVQSLGLSTVPSYDVPPAPAAPQLLQTNTYVGLASPAYKHPLLSVACVRVHVDAFRAAS